MEKLFAVHLVSIVADLSLRPDRASSDFVSLPLPSRLPLTHDSATPVRRHLRPYRPSTQLASSLRATTAGAPHRSVIRDPVGSVTDLGARIGLLKLTVGGRQWT